MKRIFLILFTVFVLSITTSITWVYLFKKGSENALKYLDTFQPNSSSLANGVYTGEFSYCFNLIKSSVRFEVKDGSIISCEFEKLPGTPHYGAPEAVKNKIISTKSFNTDAISGTTLTNNLAKAAIKSAILKNKN